MSEANACGTGLSVQSIVTDDHTSYDVGAINITIPFPSSASPDLDRARKRHLIWVADLGLWSSSSVEAAYKAADFPRFAAYTYPWAHGPDLDLITDFIGYVWLWDDSIDKPGIRNASPKQTATTLDTYRSVLNGLPTQIPEIPLVTAWRQLLDRVHKRTSEAWCHRHRVRWENTFKAFQQEADNNSRGITPTFDNYLQMRRAAGGVGTCLDRVEAIGNFELPTHVHTDRMFLSLRQNEEDIVDMINDLYSARNEWIDGNTDNIVHVLAHQEQCSWTHAREITEKTIANTIGRFQSTERLFYNVDAR
ncbi:hypothetical protein N7522_002977 [Penicillium canescens]|nr:hypothetical protein N7522_002977 [Penicillium canescens]